MIALAVLAVLAGLKAPSQAATRQALPVGYALDTFDRYGQMVLQFRSLPLEEETVRPVQPRHLFLGHASAVLKRGSYKTETRRRHRGRFQPPHFDFCRGYHQLLRALFADWRIDGTARPHLALLAGTPTKWIADRLGIRSTYLNNTFYYVLVRLERPIKRVQLVGAPQVNARFRQVVDDAPDVDSAARSLMKTFGTHYVSYFQTGDFVYQVYAYNPKTAANVDQLFDKYAANASGLDGSSRLFSPWYASHIGRVFQASAPVEFALMVAPKLSQRTWFRYYQSVFRLAESPALLAATRQLSRPMVTGVHLRSLHHLIRNGTLRNRFREVITNRLLLWDHNL